MMKIRVESRMAKNRYYPSSHLRPDLSNTIAPKQKGIGFKLRGAIFSLFLFGHCPSMKPQLNHSGSLSNKDNILLWSLKKRLASQVRPQLLVLSLYKPVMKPDISFHMFKSLCKQSTKKYKAQICFMCLLWVGGYFLYCKIIA